MELHRSGLSLNGPTVLAPLQWYTCTNDHGFKPQCLQSLQSGCLTSTKGLLKISPTLSQKHYKQRH